MKKLISITVAVLLICTAVFSYHHYTHTFTAEKWNNHRFMRKKMFEDFLKEYNLEEMSREEVIAVLGTDGNIYDQAINYVIGKELLGPAVLSIYFDENGKFQSYSIVVD